MKALILASLLAGCSVSQVNPCASQTGTCLALQIKGAPGVPPLSRLDIAISGDVMGSATSSLPQPVALPAAIAIVFDNVTGPSNIDITVVGSVQSEQARGMTTARLIPGTHIKAEVVLAPFIVDGGAFTDLSLDTDASADASVTDDALTDAAFDAQVASDLTVCPPATCTPTQCGSAVGKCGDTLDCGPCNVGAFSSVGGALTTGRYLAATAQTAHYAYLIGGYGQSGLLASIERAQIMSDGSLGNFSTVTSALTVPRGGHAALLTSSYVYVFGGATMGLGGYTTSIERAPVNPDESLGAFQVDTSISMVGPGLKGMAGIRVGDDFYLVGGIVKGSGFAGNLSVANIQVAHVQADGTLTTFAPVSAHLAFDREAFAIASGPGTVYVIGGHRLPDLGTIISSLPAEASQLSTAGTTLSIATFVAGPPPAAPHEQPAALHAGGFVYTFGGGALGVGGQSQFIERSPLDVNGNLGAFQADLGTLTGIRGSAAAFVTTSYIYLVGGFDSGSMYNTIERAPLSR